LSNQSPVQEGPAIIINNKQAVNEVLHT